MARVVKIVHFGGKDRERSVFTVDEVPPAPVIDEKGWFVDEGYFWVSIQRGDKRIAMKLSAAEAALLAARLETAVRRHAEEFMRVQEELAEEANRRAEEDRREKERERRERAREEPERRRYYRR